jgi:hypothetical protein
VDYCVPTIVRSAGLLLRARGDHAFPLASSSRFILHHCGRASTSVPARELLLFASMLPVLLRTVRFDFDMAASGIAAMWSSADEIRIFESASRGSSSSEWWSLPRHCSRVESIPQPSARICRYQRTLVRGCSASPDPKGLFSPMVSYRSLTGTNKSFRVPSLLLTVSLSCSAVPGSSAMHVR